MTFPSKYTLTRRRWGGAVFVGAALLATYTHFYLVQPNALFYRGPLIWFEHCFNLLLVSGLLGLAFCVGRRCGTWLKLDFHHWAEELAYSTGLGIGLLGLAVFGLAVVGGLRPLPIFLFLTTTGVLLRHQAWSLLRLLAEIWHRATSDLANRLTLAAFVLMSLLLFWRASVPPYGPDEGIYHLPVTQAFVEQGRVFPLLDNFSGNLPFLIHMLYAVCLLAKTDTATRIFSLSLALVFALGLYGFCRRFFVQPVARLALFIFFASSMVIEHAVTARVDVRLAGMLFLATGALMTYLETHRPGWLVLSGFLTGSAIGIKYNAILWMAGLLVMLTVQEKRAGTDFFSLAKKAVWFSSLVLLTASPWFIKNALWFHNPLYPFLTGEVKSREGNQPHYFTPADQEKIAQHVSAAEKQDPKLSANLQQELVKWAAKRPVRNPLKFWEYFTKPNHYNIADDALKPNYLFLCLPLLLLARRSKWVLWLLGISTICFLLTSRFTWLARYYLPVYPTLTVVTAYALHAAGNRLSQWVSWGVWLPPAITAVCLSWVLVVFSQEALAQKHWQFISGNVSRHEFLMSARGDYRMINFMNAELPVGNKVLMLGAQLSYGLLHPHRMDGGWSAIEWRRLLAANDSLEQVHEKLKQTGVLYIAYQPNSFGFVASIGEKGSGPSGDTTIELFGGKKEAKATQPDYHKQFQNWLTFETYSRKYLERIYGNDKLYGFKVYRLL